MMMKRTNINITSHDKSFNYLIEYKQDSIYSDIGSLKYMKIDFLDRVDIVKDEDYIYYENDWYSTDNWLNFIKKPSYDTVYLPETFDKSIIKFNFPEYSPETYEADIYYMLSVNTWINGKYVYLGSKLFNRYNALANEKTI